MVRFVRLLLLLALLLSCGCGCSRCERPHASYPSVRDLKLPIASTDANSSCTSTSILRVTTCHRRSSPRHNALSTDANRKHAAAGSDYDLDSIASIDSTLQPDYWNLQGEIDARIPTNGDPPEQLVKVTDRRHRHPVFATICSLAFLLTIVAIIVVCSQ